jgi:hypothetical protein
VKKPTKLSEQTDGTSSSPGLRSNDSGAGWKHIRRDAKFQETAQHNDTRVPMKDPMSASNVNLWSSPESFLVLRPYA